MRIVVGIVSGIILGLWKMLIQVVAIIHWIIVVFSGKRSKDLAIFANYWNTQAYRFIRYMTFTTNERPWPFTERGKELNPVDFKKK